MNQEAIEQKRKEIIDQYGEWVGDNIQLSGDLYTIDKHSRMSLVRIRRIVQMIADIAGSFEGLKILDLGSFEGGYSIEFALHGAEVVGIEARQTNLEKARFAKEVLALKNVEFVQDDVRNLSAQKYGQFDLISCSGLLYHLDASDVFNLLAAMSEVTRRCLIIDTHFSVAPRESQTYKGKEYWGWSFTEYTEPPTHEQQEQAVGSSIRNLKSFWLTRASLFNILADVGFTSVYECQNPAMPEVPQDRITLVAIKGTRSSLLSRPHVRNIQPEDHSETPISGVSQVQLQADEKQPDEQRPNEQQPDEQQPSEFTCQQTDNASLARHFARKLPSPVKKYLHKIADRFRSE